MSKHSGGTALSDGRHPALDEAFRKIKDALITLGVTCEQCDVAAVSFTRNSYVSSNRAYLYVQCPCNAKTSWRQTLEEIGDHNLNMAIHKLLSPATAPSGQLSVTDFITATADKRKAAAQDKATIIAAAANPTSSTALLVDLATRSTSKRPNQSPPPDAASIKRQEIGSDSES